MGADIANIRIGAETLERKQPKGEVRDQRLRFTVRTGAPVGAAEPGADDRAAVAPVQPRQERDADRLVGPVDDGELKRNPTGSALG